MWQMSRQTLSGLDEHSPYDGPHSQHLVIPYRGTGLAYSDRARSDGRRQRLYSGDVMSRQEVLVDADWLEEHAGDDNIVVVEVDEDTTAYDGGHIKGAIKLDWK